MADRLVGRWAKLASERSRGAEPRHVEIETVWPRPRTICGCALGAPPHPRPRARSAPVRMSGAGYRAMSSMFTPALPRASAISATVPGRFSTLSRSSSRARRRRDPPPGAGGGPRARRRARPPTRSPSPDADHAPRPREGARRRRRSRAATASRLVAKMSRPDRRVGAGDAGRVAKARADLGQALGLLDQRAAAACWTSTLASTCGRWLTVAISRSWVSGVDRLRARAEVRDGPLQAVVVDAARALGRRQVPAGALEQVGARVLDARASRRRRADGRR